MDVNLISEMRGPMAEENRRLKRMWGNVSMQNDHLKGTLGKYDTARVSRESSADKGRQHCAGLQGIQGQRDMLPA